MNSTNSDSIKSGLGPHPRVQVYKKEVSKLPWYLLTTNCGKYFFLFVPFFLWFCILKSKKNELKNWSVSFQPNFSISHCLPTIVCLLQYCTNGLDILWQTARNTHSHMKIGVWKRRFQAKSTGKLLSSSSCSEWVIIKSWICFLFNRC